MTQVTFSVGDKVRVKKIRQDGWLAFGDTREEYTVSDVLPGSWPVLRLDDGTEAAAEWFELQN